MKLYRPISMQNSAHKTAQPNLLKTSQQGFSIVEMMIAIAMGLALIAAVTALVVTSLKSQSTQNNTGLMQESAHFALGNIERAIKQAGYINYDKADAPFITTPDMTANIVGFDNKKLGATSIDIASPSSESTNSDILAVRFFGSGDNADNTIVNCAGHGVSEPTNQGRAEDDRGWSIYYVATNNGKSELMCKYLGANNIWAADAIIQDVQSFQVLYGVDINNDGIADKYLNATEVTTLDSVFPPAELNQKTHWKKIAAIKVAILMQSPTNGAISTAPTTYNLFGPDYSAAKSATDLGTKIVVDDAKLHKVYSATFQLKNPT